MFAPVPIKAKLTSVVPPRTGLCAPGRPFKLKANLFYSPDAAVPQCWGLGFSRTQDRVAS